MVKDHRASFPNSHKRGAPEDLCMHEQMVEEGVVGGMVADPGEPTALIYTGKVLCQLWPCQVISHAGTFVAPIAVFMPIPCLEDPNS